MVSLTNKYLIMKKHTLKFVVLFAIISSLAFDASAQFVVKIRPTAPVIVRPVAPTPRHVWIDGDWVWRGNNYQYVNGYWASPVAVGAAWVPGHWKSTRRGWIWKKGHWRR